MQSSDLDIVDTLIEEWEKECPDLDVSAMALVGRVLMISHKLHHRVNEVLSAYDLHYSDFDVLATLRRSGAPYELAPTELMRSVLLTSGAMTALLDRLAKRGLIRRKADLHDKRIRTAALTSKGKTLVEKAAKARFLEGSEATACFSVREQNDIARSLSKLNCWLDDLSEAD